MHTLSGGNLRPHLQFLQSAAVIAKEARCRRALCGTVIVDGRDIIGRGFNAPPLNDENNRRCAWKPDRSRKPKYDLTCCVHAEWRAILNACVFNGDRIIGSTLYFMRVDGLGNFTDAGMPYCTTCSRLAMESGIAEFCLWNNGMLNVYAADEYDRLSAAYFLN